MLGGVGVDDAHSGVDVVDEHRRRLIAAQRSGDPLAVHRGLQLPGELPIGRIGEFGAGGDQHAGGHLVVLGLADQVGGHVGGVGGVIGQDRDLGRAGFGVDAHLRTADALGGRDIDVAGPGDHVDRRELAAIRVGAPVGE